MLISNTATCSLVVDNSKAAWKGLPPGLTATTPDCPFANSPTQLHRTVAVPPGNLRSASAQPRNDITSGEDMGTRNRPPPLLKSSDASEKSRQTCVDIQNSRPSASQVSMG